MEKEYIIKKVKKPIDAETWRQVKEISIDTYLWETNGYRPKVKAAVCHTDTGLHVHFTSWENNITVKYFKGNDPVYKDSCVEFFLNAMPEKGTKYMNFEINAAGVLLFGMGTGRHDWKLLNDVDHSVFGISTSVPESGYDNFKGPFWTIEYTIPFDFLKEHFCGFQTSSGKKMKANFYKCGDETAYPHYGCWNPIDESIKDFHTPEFFGGLILE